MNTEAEVTAIAFTASNDKEYRAPFWIITFWHNV